MQKLVNTRVLPANRFLKDNSSETKDRNIISLKKKKFENIVLN